jgi:HAD superfamily hydrolase (TIGR01509 family)
MIKGVLLDVDGTLVLSNDAHAWSWVEAFKQFGYDVKNENVRKLIGMGGDKLMPQVIPSLDNETGVGKQISDYRSKLFLNKYAPKLNPTPGSRAFVKKLKNDGFKLIVASSANKKELGMLLKAAQCDDLLPHATTSDDANNSKPEPDIIHAALEKLQLPAHETIMVGDTPYDLEAANRAGVELIGVRCGGWSDNEIENAKEIYNDPSDILVHYNSSIFSK